MLYITANQILDFLPSRHPELSVFSVHYKKSTCYLLEKSNPSRSIFSLLYSLLQQLRYCSTQSGTLLTAWPIDAFKDTPMSEIWEFLINETTKSIICLQCPWLVFVYLPALLFWQHSYQFLMSGCPWMHHQGEFWKGFLLKTAVRHSYKLLTKVWWRQNWLLNVIDNLSQASLKSHLLCT